MFGSGLYPLNNHLLSDNRQRQDSAGDTVSGGRFRTHPAIIVFLIVIVFLIIPESSGGTFGQGIEDRTRVVYECDFRSKHDTNVDRQPDGWRRRRDRAHPAFINAKIVPRDPTLSLQAREFQLTVARLYQSWKQGRLLFDYVPESFPPLLIQMMEGPVVNNCYEVRMDGGNFELASPQFPIDPRLSYQLQAEMACEGLFGHEASVELQVFNRSGQLVGIYPTSPVSDENDWHNVKTSLINIDSLQPLIGEIHLRVQSQGNGFIGGRVRFDNIRLYQLPNMTLSCDSTHHFVTSGHPPRISLEAVGLPTNIEMIDFELLDVDGQVVDGMSVPLALLDTIEVLDYSNTKPTGGRLVRTGSGNHRSRSLNKTWSVTKAEWTPALNQPGFYRVRASIDQSIQQEISVVVSESSTDEPGPFGWSILNCSESFLNKDLPDIAKGSGVGWLKVPIWLDHHNEPVLAATGAVLSQLQAAGVHLVGAFDRPPQTKKGSFDNAFDKLHPAAVISDPQIWSQFIKPIINQLGMKFEWLQIGADNDRDFSEQSALSPLLREIHEKIQVSGQDLKLVIGWDWQSPLENHSLLQAELNPVCRALAFSSTLLTSRQQMSDVVQSNSRLRRQSWTAINTLPKSQYSLPERVIDLIEQMILVKEIGIDAAFITQLADDDLGLFQSNSHAGELLFPWLHMVESIGSRDYVGSLNAPLSSTNHVFENSQGAVVVLWNRSPVVETFYLGAQVSAADIWGRQIPIEFVRLESGSVIQRIPVGPWPVIVKNADASLIKWQQAFELLADHLSSVASNQEVIPVIVQNTLNGSAEGKICVHCSPIIKGGFFSQEISIPHEQAIRLEMPFDFRHDASAGQHQLEFAFDIQSDRRHQFSIFRDIRVGDPHVEMQWEILRMDDSLVEVKVEVLNSTENPLNFDCKLFPLNSVYSRLQIVNAGSGTSTHQYKVPIPLNSSGQETPIWIRCEQIGAPLILNYRVVEQYQGPAP